MPDLAALLLFSGAALLLALMPGPGLFYVAGRALAGGRADGIASALGAGLGGLVHVAAGAVGVSALLMASAEAFTMLKIAGGLYLVWLGVRAWRTAGKAPPTASGVPRNALRDGALVEALNPKTAAFFLALIPQFIDPAGAVMTQFIVFGTVSVGLNTLVALGVAEAAGRARGAMSARPGLVRRLQRASGVALGSLGVALLAARRPAA